MLDLLYDGGCHLVHTVGHGYPAGGTNLEDSSHEHLPYDHSYFTNLNLVFTFVTYDMTIAAAGDWWGSGDREADRALNTFLGILIQKI